LSNKRFTYSQAAILQQGAHLGDQLDYPIRSQPKFGQGAAMPCIVHLRANTQDLQNYFAAPATTHMDILGEDISHPLNRSDH
jgi:hypothetical protein